MCKDGDSTQSHVASSLAVLHAPSFLTSVLMLRSFLHGLAEASKA
jgi:hypothetical protein